MVIAFVGGREVDVPDGDVQQVLTALAGYTERVGLWSDRGKFLGWLVPPSVDSGPLCPWEPDLTREEMERRIAEPGGMTLDDFWRKMGVKP
jgi:hypothetical protein